MIGYEQDGNVKGLSSFKTGLAGAFSGGVTRFILQPFDVIKIVFQLQVESISNKNSNAKYKSIPQAVKSIVEEEGIYNLWKGHTSAQLLSVIYGFSQFVTFDAMMKQLYEVVPLAVQESKFHFLVGFFSTSVATFLSFPFDVVRTRFVAQSTNKVYKTTPHALFVICTKEGYTALYKGFGVTVLQAAPYGGAQFYFYNLFSHLYCNGVLWNKNNNNRINSKDSIGHALSGFFAGVCSKSVVYPLDVCKKRLQLQGFQNHRGTQFGEPFICSGLMDCAYKIYQKESFAGFFKGLKPALLKSSLVCALNFTLFEKFINKFRSAEK